MSVEDIYRALGWNDGAAISADIAAGHGQDKVNSYYASHGGGGSSGGGGSQDLRPTTADFQKLEEQSFQILKPYYTQLATESRGDFNRAVGILNEDYKIGVRQAVEDYATSVKNTNSDLTNSLAQFGITTQREGEQKTDELNKRGMAVGQMTGPDQFQILTGGRGATEINQLRTDQSLRKEAIQRAADKAIEQATITRNRATNTAGTNGDPNALAAVGDRTQLGSLELGVVRGTEQKTREQQIADEQLFERRRQEAQNIATQFSNTKDKEIAQSVQNQYTTNALKDFVERGV